MSNNTREIIVGVDASRNRSGGAKAHLIGVLKQGNPLEQGIRQVHVWSYKMLLDSLPGRPWLIKHNPVALEQSLIRQVLWQVFSLPAEMRKVGCDIMLNTDAGTLSNVKPSVTISQDMLSYEPGEAERYGWSKARLRLLLLRYIQNRSLRRADGAIFLTNYAASIIQRSCGTLSSIAIIPHGVGDNFKVIVPTDKWPNNNERPIRILYISNVAWYKHQWMVVRAVELLKKKGKNVMLTLVGGGSGPAQQRLEKLIALSDPKGEYIRQIGFVPQSDLPAYLAQADIFVFASSCENMPNTLVEAMAAGLPIACSNRGPMPEILRDGGVYFDPEDPEAIAQALNKLMTNSILRQYSADKAKQRAMQYSWYRCAKETWEFVVKIYWRVKNSRGRVA